MYGQGVAASLLNNPSTSYMCVADYQVSMAHPSVTSNVASIVVCMDICSQGACTVFLYNSFR